MLIGNSLSNSNGGRGPVGSDLGGTGVAFRFLDRGGPSIATFWK